MSSCYECRFYTGESFLPCTVNAEVAQNEPEIGCWEFEPDPNPWGFWSGPLVNPPHVDDVQIGWVSIDGWKQLSCKIPLYHWRIRSCANCAFSGLMQPNPNKVEFVWVCAVNPLHVADEELATAPLGGYQCPHWEKRANSGYKPVKLFVKYKHNYSLIAALAAGVAIATIGLIQTLKVDPDLYELSPPSSVQHIRED